MRRSDVLEKWTVAIGTSLGVVGFMALGWYWAVGLVAIAGLVLILIGD